MIRRAFLCSLVALVTCLGPIGRGSSADPQQPSPPRRIAVLFAGSWSDEMLKAIRQGLRDAGYVEGPDVVIEWRHEGNYDHLPKMAADLVSQKVEVIVVSDTPSAEAVKHATKTVPIVMLYICDPVGSGLVTSLAHPGGNVTGVTQQAPDISAKQLQLLKEALPRVTRVTVLWNPGTPCHPKLIDELKAAAPALSIELNFVGVQKSEQLGPAFSDIRRAHAQALYVLDSAFVAANGATILALASQARLPVFHGSRQYANKGGLMFYGYNLEDQAHHAAGYVGKILKGSQPGDLPIEQPTKFELVVNLRTAKALGITIPESILLRADEVIR